MGDVWLSERLFRTYYRLCRVVRSNEKTRAVSVELRVEPKLEVSLSVSHLNATSVAKVLTSARVETPHMAMD